MTSHHRSPTPRPLLTVVALCTAVGLLSACAPQPLDDWASTHEIRWHVDTALLSVPVIAGDVVLGYAATDGGTQTLNAWDLDDGTLLWQRVTLPGRNPRGVKHRVAVLEAEDGWHVSALVPWRPTAATNEWSRVEILDVRTGRSLAPEVASIGVWAHRPYVCGPGDDRFCVRGVLEPETDTTHDAVHEYSVADQVFSRPQASDAGYFEGGTAVSDRVSFTEQGQLQYGENGELLWERAYTDVFGEGTDPSGGWQWSDPATDDAPLLALGFESAPDVDWSVSHTIERDLTTARFVRLDRTSGATVWSLNADSCGFIADFRLQQEDGVATLCQFREGTRTLHWDGTKVVLDEYVDVDVDLIGIDVTDGEVAWRVPLGEAAGGGVMHPETAFLSRGPKRVVPDGSGHTMIVDVHSGTTDRIAQNQLLLCTTGADTVELKSIWHDPVYVLEDAFELCDGDGSVAEDGVPQTATLAIAGFDTSEPVAIYMADGLTVFEAAGDE